MIRRFLKDFWPSMLTLAVILYAVFASDPLPDTKMPPIPHLDKIIHAVMMGGLVGAVAFDLQRKNTRVPKLSFKLMASIWLGVALFSAFTEIAQSALTRTRQGDLSDLAADLIGAAAAVYLAPPAIRAVLRIK
ncbi:MAG: VanZ family protein [Clostridium sp.]|nr:VanZ family protein [Clostridium sp.]